MEAAGAATAFGVMKQNKVQTVRLDELNDIVT